MGGVTKEPSNGSMEPLSKFSWGEEITVKRKTCGSWGSMGELETRMESCSSDL